MDKLQMAHEFMMKKMETEAIDNHWELFYSSWRYADAMQAKAEERECKERPDVLKEDWQPDWSQAPEWANSWGMAETGQAWWLSGEWHVNNRGGFSSTGFIKAEKAPSFDYQGNWKESLRKRPQ